MFAPVLFSDEKLPVIRFQEKTQSEWGIDFVLQTGSGSLTASELHHFHIQRPAGRTGLVNENAENTVIRPGAFPAHIVGNRRVGGGPPGHASFLAFGQLAREFKDRAVAIL